MDETDEQLLGWSKAGDQAAFVEIFWRHGSAVHAYLSRRAGRQDADDLLSEVWLRAFRGRTSYDCRYPDARPWLYGIARNVLRAHWREADRPLAFTEEAAATDPWSDADRRLDAAAQVEMWTSCVGLLRDAPAMIGEHRGGCLYKLVLTFVCCDS